jgi:hypothetical protein
VQQGDDAADQRLVPLVDQELGRVASARLRAEPAAHILQTTALVHETYLRLVDVDRLNVRNRAHLLAVAARLSSDQERAGSSPLLSQTK